MPLEEPEPVALGERPEIFNETHEFQESRYAGSFLPACAVHADRYWGIFQRFFDLMSCCESYRFASLTTSLGGYALVIYLSAVAQAGLFAMMLIHNLRNVTLNGVNGSVEQLKTVYRREFGRILGLKQLFRKELLWEKIHQACAQKVSLALVEEFFKRQAQLGLVSLWCIYIDGHFIPYYGKERVRSGYYTQRGHLSAVSAQAGMMPGQTEMFAHDGQGRIVPAYAGIQHPEGTRQDDLKAMMRKMSDLSAKAQAGKWASYIGGKAPLIVVEREAWGVEHFISLKGYRFVTWDLSARAQAGKYSDPQELAAIPEGRFGEGFWVNNKEYQALEEKKLYHDQGSKHSIELRRIIIWNKGSDHRVACVTQDDQEDTITIPERKRRTFAMLGRWGISENGFKHMGDRLNMDYNPLLELEKGSQRQDVANPRHKELQRKVKELKKRLNKCERDLGRLPLTYKPVVSEANPKDGTLRMSKRRQRLQEQQNQWKIQLACSQKELEGCPERIDLSDINEEKFKEIGTEGKNLWDLAQSLVWNSRKKLIELFANFLPNPRDLIPVPETSSGQALEAISRCRGWIKTTPEAVLISLYSRKRVTGTAGSP